MAQWPAWKDQTIDQKLEFLQEWLRNTETAIEKVRSDNQALYERLRRVEVENASRPTPDS
jgi:hypothetical protein